MKLDDNYSYKPSYDPFEGVMTRNGLPADEVISALQKSIRHADEDTAVRCGYEMYVTSPELEKYLWKRLSIISVEDIGFGEPMAPVLIQTLKVMREDFPYVLTGSRALFLFQAIRYLCMCQKERSSDTVKTLVIEEYKRGQYAKLPEGYDIYDWHTRKGKEMGRTYMDFLEIFTDVTPFMDKYDPALKERLKQYVREDEALGQL